MAGAPFIPAAPFHYRSWSEADRENTSETTERTHRENEEFSPGPLPTPETLRPHLLVEVSKSFLTRAWLSTASQAGLLAPRLPFKGVPAAGVDAGIRDEETRSLLVSKFNTLFNEIIRKSTNKNIIKYMISFTLYFLTLFQKFAAMKD